MLVPSAYLLLRSSLLTRILPSAARSPYLGQVFHRCTMSTTSQSSKEPLALGTILTSDSGRTYKVEQILSDRRHPMLLFVYRASAEGKNYIVKNIIPSDFELQLDLQKQLSSCPNLRAVTDLVKELKLFIYPFLASDLLRFSQKPLSKETRISILRSALQGLVNMHDRKITHNGIKPNNILLDYEESTDGSVNIKNIQISDLEDTVILGDGESICGVLCGNAIWRSPESWCRSWQDYSSDVFSFAIVMIYVMLNKMVFRVSDEQLDATDSWRYVLPRHISIFADEDSFRGFLEYIGTENPFYKHFIVLAADTYIAENIRQPFVMWDFVEPEFRDLVGKMTKFDPRQRITAREALQHRWSS